MPSISTLLLESTEVLRNAGIQNARLDAGLLLSHILGVDRTFIISHSDEPVSTIIAENFQKAIQRRAQGEPVQYITGKQQFYKLEFEVTPDVLIPRPETELLVEQALTLMPNTALSPLICDVGTGSGCILVSLLHQRTTAKGVGIDISERAIRVAKRNSRRHNVLSRLALVVGDCFNAVKAHPFFDLVVSNPPYVSQQSIAGLQREVRDYEPRVALSPGGDGLSIIWKLMMQSASVLKPAGYLLIEIGFDQRERVVQSLDTEVWNLLDVHVDLQGIPRTVVLQKR